MAAQSTWLRCSIRARLDQFEKVNVGIRVIRSILRIDAVADDGYPPHMHQAKALRSATNRDGRRKKGLEAAVGKLSATRAVRSVRGFFEVPVLVGYAGTSG